jgi:hypothetical protein
MQYRMDSCGIEKVTCPSQTGTTKQVVKQAFLNCNHLPIIKHYVLGLFEQNYALRMPCHYGRRVKKQNASDHHCKVDLTRALLLC